LRLGLSLLTLLLGEFSLEALSLIAEHLASDHRPDVRLERILNVGLLRWLLLLAVGMLLHSRRHLGLGIGNLSVLSDSLLPLELVFLHLLLENQDGAGTRDGVSSELRLLHLVWDQILGVDYHILSGLLSFPEAEGLFSLLRHLHGLAPHGVSPGFLSVYDALVARDEDFRRDRLVAELVVDSGLLFHLFLADHLLDLALADRFRTNLVTDIEFEGARDRNAVLALALDFCGLGSLRVILVGETSLAKGFACIVISTNGLHGVEMPGPSLKVIFFFDTLLVIVELVKIFLFLILHGLLGLLTDLK